MSSPQGTINIRTATPTDAQAIANIHVAAWRAAYINIVSKTYLDNLCINDRVKLWQRVLSDSDTAGSILVAEASSQSMSLLGFVSFGPAAAATPEASNKEDKIAELRAIYIDPGYWAKGIGQVLWKAAQQKLMHEEERFMSVVVKVFAGNERAIRFYTAAGFEGEEKGVIEVGGEKLETLRLRKGLV